MPRTLTVEVFGPHSIVQGLKAAEISGVIDAPPGNQASSIVPEIVLPESVRGLLEVRSITPATINLN